MYSSQRSYVLLSRGHSSFGTGRHSLGIQRHNRLSTKNNAVKSLRPNESARDVPRKQPLFLRWYSDKLETHPLLTKGITSGLIAAAGDLICQWSLSRKDKEKWWDEQRTFRFGFLGCFLVAPVIHFWYGALATYIPGTHAGAILQRVSLDQFVFTPIFIPTWLCSLWTLEKLDDNIEQPNTNYFERLQSSIPDILVANWALWIPVMALNFRLVPVKYQVLFSNVAALLWNAYLSFSTNRSQQGRRDD